MIAFLAKRAIPGVGPLTARYPGASGHSAAGGSRSSGRRARTPAPSPARTVPGRSLRITERVRGLDPTATRCRSRHLGRDRRLAAIARRHPGLRLPGA